VIAVLEDLLIGWGSLNVLVVVLVLGGLIRRRYDPELRELSSRVAATRDAVPWA
jgi:hypothetical protein